MFNYNKPWNNKLDSEIVEGVISGKPVTSIAESIGKTVRQVYHRIEFMKKEQLKKMREHRMIEEEKKMIRVDGSFDYTKNLKLGE